MLCEARLVWRNSASQIFVYFLSGISINYHYTINNRPTYILHCEANGVPYEWNYPKTHVSELVGKRITIYVNPENSEEYFVNLKSITA